MDSDDEGEEQKKTKAPKFPIQMFISEGNKYFLLAKYDLAIKFFNIALEREPNNEKSLVGRSKCKMRLAKYSEAMEDAEEALKANKNSCDAKLLIGEAEYFLGDFEKSFITFYRGHQARTNNEMLRCGHQMSKKAIDNALKPDKPVTFTDTDVSGVSKLGSVQDDEQVTQSSTRKDLLSPDVDFVETLLLDDSLDSVHPLCKYLSTYLKDRQTFWRSQYPKTSKKKAKVKDSVAPNDNFAIKIESPDSEEKANQKDNHDLSVKLATETGKEHFSKLVTESGKEDSSKTTTEAGKWDSSEIATEAGKQDSLKLTPEAGKDVTSKVTSEAGKDNSSKVTAVQTKNDQVVTSKVTTEADDANISVPTNFTQTQSKTDDIKINSNNKSQETTFDKDQNDNNKNNITETTDEHKEPKELMLTEDRIGQDITYNVTTTEGKDQNTAVSPAPTLLKEPEKDNAELNAINSSKEISSDKKNTYEEDI